MHSENPSKGCGPLAQPLKITNYVQWYDPPSQGNFYGHPGQKGDFTRIEVCGNILTVVRASLRTRAVP